MAFIPVGKKRSFRASDLFDSPVAGTYLKKTDGKFSPIHWFKKEDGEEFSVYGCKSLDSKLTDDLFGQLLQIRCVKLIDIGKAYPMAIMEVCVWCDDGQAHVNPVADVYDPSMPRPQILVTHPIHSIDEDDSEYPLTAPEE